MQIEANWYKQNFGTKKGVEKSTAELHNTNSSLRHGVFDLESFFVHEEAIEEFSRDDKNQAGFIAPVGKGPVTGGKPNGVPYNFGKGSGTKGKEKCTKDSDFNPSVVNNQSLVDTAIGVGESGTKKPSVGLNTRI